jgi:hypothetical protein
MTKQHFTFNEELIRYAFNSIRLKRLTEAYNIELFDLLDIY